MGREVEKIVIVKRILLGVFVILILSKSVYVLAQYGGYLVYSCAHEFTFRIGSSHDHNSSNSASELQSPESETSQTTVEEGQATEEEQTITEDEETEKETDEEPVEDTFEEEVTKDLAKETVEKSEEEISDSE